MALMFVVEDGTGLANATSYASEAEGLQHLENLGREAEWTGTSDQLKASLNAGTAYLEQRYGPLLRGTRATLEQALNVPRVGAVDNDGWSILYDSVHPALKAATIEAAVRHRAGTSLQPDTLAGAAGIQREKVQVGALQRDITYRGSGKTTMPRFPVITRILVDAGIIDSAQRVYRV